LSSSPLAKLGRLGDAVMIRHSLFSLPWALAALLLASAGFPDPWKLLWIVLAAVGARNAANALNRLVDERFDAANPRTAGRDLPSGRVSRRDLWLLALAMAVLMVGATWMLGWLCVALLPVAGVFVVGYSYTKRFTWLCHYWLGFTCALAPMGAFIALTGHFEARFFVLMGAVALWVAGFDILYATQDIAFDRRMGLKSIPARFGARGAFWISRASHLGTVAGLALTGLLWPLGWWYWLGVAAAAGLLAAEHGIARGGSERHLRVASYGINEVVGVVFLAFTALAVYTAPGTPLSPAASWFALDVFGTGFWTFQGWLP